LGRPGLKQHRKFRRLAHAIGPIRARGALALLWEPCDEAGESFLGSDGDVEMIAEWDGDPGVLVKALAQAGGEGNPGFIKWSETQAGWCATTLGGVRQRQLHQCMG
jgi:hypothetical protein